MPTPIDIGPRAAVAQAGLLVLVGVVFVGIAFRASVPALVVGVVVVAALTVRSVQMRVQANGDHLVVRNFWSQTRVDRAAIAEFTVADVIAPGRVRGSRRVVVVHERAGHHRRLTATSRVPSDPDEADGLCADLNGWLEAGA